MSDTVGGARTASAWNASGWYDTGPLGGANSGTGAGSAFVYDPTLRGDLYFGGSPAALGTASNQTWLFNGTGWHQLSPTRSPPEVTQESMAWDASDDEMILFGGTADSGIHGLNTTWAFANGTWANDTQPVAPPRSMDVALFSDPEDGSVILFGGYLVPPSGISSYSNATWRFAAGEWRALSEPRAPSPRVSAAAVWDSSTEEAILFGGYGYLAETGYVYSSDTWAFANGTWAPLSPRAAPPGRDAAVLGDAPALGGVVLFGGGYGGGADLNDTWVFAADNWTRFQSSPAPPPNLFGNLGFATSWDGQALTLFMVYLTSSSVYATTTWEFSTLQPTIRADPALEEGDQPIALGVAVAGRTVAQNDSWDFGDGTTGNGSMVTHVFPGPTSDVVTVTVVDANGRVASTSVTVAVRGPLTLGATVAPPVGKAPLTVRFAGWLSGGDPPYGAAWSSPTIPDLGGTAGSLAIDQPGTFWLTFAGTDAANYTVERTFLVTVLPASNLTALSATIVSNASSGTAPFSFLLAGLASGGAPPYSFAWQFSDGTTALGGTVYRTLLTAGTYSASLRVTDAAGDTAAAITTVRVDPAFFVAAQTTPATDAGTVTAEGSGFGGVAPYAYYWNWGDGNTSAGATASHHFARSGTFRVELSGIDAAGHTAIAWTNATVVVPPSGFPALPSAPPISLVEAAVALSSAVIGALVGVTLVLVRGRRPPRASPSRRPA